ncbi:HAD family hydrolase [Dyadobacter arcticus]|uniref:Hydrolase of the HAD superfamily n=1 Tax=Dyadobacter arcticus TaxID=1078754 RepID=A0ABX0UJF4_9BACT|nr:HAD family hydrolase [Dyadobacter arcticus]NIJ53148.1 putative hydrolase of the HAD superfamily [Dyadobacter arcticus]
MIKGILLDYGGTIDTNGLHWANVLWESYQRNKVNADRETFAKAYTFGEKALAMNPIVKPHHVFYDVLFLKVEQQFNFLKEKGFEVDDAAIETIAGECNDFAHTTVKNATLALAQLAANYPIVMVSNFYGNIQNVLQDFGIGSYFQAVVESAVVGVRKPDPQIYQLGIDILGFAPAECVVVGDSYSKDINPAKQLGCKAIWLNVKGWDEALEPQQISEADVEITDFNQITEAIKDLG